MVRRVLFVCLALSLLLCAVACGSESPIADVEPTVIVTETVLPTPTLIVATHTLPPPPTMAEPATSTPMPTAVPTETPVLVNETVLVTPLPPFVAPDGFVDPDAFPDNLNPFTGAPITEERREQRPIAVKISNYPPEVRPQWGLNQADLVFEHYAEGGVTRFTALFYGGRAPQVGSIRSGRLIDLEIPKMYDAAFAYSGSAGLVREKFRDSDFFERIISPDFAHGGFERIPDGDKAFEHTLFTNTDTLHYLLDLRGEDVRPVLPQHMSFSRGLPADGQAASQVEVRYGGTNSFWSYHSGRYWRWTDGTIHVDAATGEQLNFKNIVVVYAHHQDTDILEDNNNGGNYSIQIQIWGRGRVTIFRDGQMFEGEWRREDPNHMLTFYDLDGNPLPLAFGNSFFQMAPNQFEGVIVTP